MSELELCGDADCEGMGKCPCRDWSYLKVQNIRRWEDMIISQETEKRMKLRILVALDKLFESAVVTHQETIKVIKNCE